MKILVFSDTHHNDSFMLKALQQHMNDTDLIIHLGDHVSDTKCFRILCPHIANINIRGNCDFSTYGDYSKEEALFEIGNTGIKAFACHGHQYSVKDGHELLYSKARMTSAKLVLYGHTHIPEIKEINGIYIVNPGSASVPRCSEPPSYGIIRVEDNRIVPSIIYERN